MIVQPSSSRGNSSSSIAAGCFPVS